MMMELVKKMSDDFYLHERLSRKYPTGFNFRPDDGVLEELLFKEESTLVYGWDLFTRNRPSSFFSEKEFLAVYNGGKYVVGGGFNKVETVKSDLGVMTDYIFTAGALSRAVRHPLIDVVGSVSMMATGTYLGSRQVTTTLDIVAHIAGFSALVYSGGLLFGHGISKTVNRQIESKLSMRARKYRYGHGALTHLYDCLEERRFQKE